MERGPVDHRRDEPLAGVTVRRGLNPWLVAVGVIAVALGVLALLGKVLHTQTTKVVAFEEAIARLEVDTSNGDIVVITGSDPGIRVEYVATHGFPAPDPTTRISGDALVIDAGCRSLPLPFIGGCRVDFRITAPAGILVDLESSNGDVEVEGVVGQFVATTSNGDVIGRRLGASGVEVDSSNGGIRISFTQAPDRIRAETANGSITIEVPDLPYRVDADTANGDLTLDLVADPDATRVIEAESANGDITIRRR